MHSHPPSWVVINHISAPLRPAIPPPVDALTNVGHHVNMSSSSKHWSKAPFTQTNEVLTFLLYSALPFLSASTGGEQRTWKTLIFPKLAHYRKPTNDLESPAASHWPSLHAYVSCLHRFCQHHQHQHIKPTSLCHGLQKIRETLVRVPWM